MGIANMDTDQKNKFWTESLVKPIGAEIQPIMESTFKCGISTWEKETKTLDLDGEVWFKQAYSKKTREGNQIAFTCIKK